MLHFEYPLCVCLFLFPLVFYVAGERCLIFVGGGVGVEDSYIKKCLLHHGVSGLCWSGVYILNVWLKTLVSMEFPQSGD